MMRGALTKGIIVLLALILTACSADKINPAAPDDFETVAVLPVVKSDTSTTNHHLLAIRNLRFDVDSLTTIVESNRLADMHYNVTFFLPSPIISINSYDPLTNIIDIDLTIQNSFMIDGYDLRVIVYTDSSGHILVNSDDWTELYDIPGGLPINPFKAYSKLEFNRKFFAFAQRTENFQILLPGGNPYVTIAIDVSYPGNCEEPYEINDYCQGNLQYTPGSSAEIQVKVLDWQNDVNAVYLYCPQITGITVLPFTQIDTETWETTIINNTGAQAGDYTGFIIARSANSGSLALYEKVTVRVSPDQGWAISWGGGEDTRAAAYSNITDHDGNIIVTGRFSRTVDFDPGQDVFELSSVENSSDVFLSKFDQNGSFLWVKAWGGSSNDEGYGFAVDDENNIYIHGLIDGYVDLDPGPDEDLHSADDSSFLSKFNSDGEYQWGLHLHRNMFIHEIVVDLQKNIYIVGEFSGGVTDFDPGQNEDIHWAYGGSNAFLCKFFQFADYMWGYSWGADDWDDIAFGVAFMAPDRLYVVGSFGGTVDFCPGAPVIEATADGTCDAYMSRFDIYDDFYWVKTWGGPQWDMANDVAINSPGDIVVSGVFSETVDFDPGPGVVEYQTNGNLDNYVTKFGSFGNFLWARIWGSEGNEQYAFTITDDEGNIWVGACFRETIDFDPGPGVVELTPDYTDSYLSKFNSNGDFEWVRSWDAGFAGYCRAVSCDNAGNTFISTCLAGTVDLDPGPDINEHVCLGDSWAALIKYLPNGYWD